MVFYSKVPGIKNIQASFSLVMSLKWTQRDMHVCSNPGGSNLFMGWTELLRSAGVHRGFSKKADSTFEAQDDKHD